MYPCTKCLENNWDLKKERDIDEVRKIKYKWITATCKMCGNEVEFGHKQSKLKPGIVAEYEIRGGKRFLKIEGKFVEVDLFKINKKGLKDPNGPYLKVMPCQNP